MPLREETQCPHTQLLTVHSPHAEIVGHKGPTARQRSTALGGSNYVSTNVKPSLDDLEFQCFPAPLVLPEDDLAEDPNYPPQSFSSWAREKDRNPVTRERRTLYICASPTISDQVSFMRQWRHLGSKAKDKRKIPLPHIEDVIQYLAAFYTGLPVRQFPVDELEFIAWDDPAQPKKRKKGETSAIGLRAGASATRIRFREKDQIYQLNLDDLLDAAIEMVPSDAYAVLMLVEQDLYQSKEDEFVCGMAIGGSRVAVVSMARYNPCLDKEMEVERAHAWPASHCEAYVRIMCSSHAVGSRPSKKARVQAKPKEQDNVALLPLRAAIDAHAALPPITARSTAEQYSNLWLGRVCRTASHELGHCFGIDHCPYFACNMNASASIREDPRQALYLCPVDLEKVKRATGASTTDWYEAVGGFCEGKRNVHIFAAMRAWCKSMSSLQAPPEVKESSKEKRGNKREAAIEID